MTFTFTSFYQINMLFHLGLFGAFVVFIIYDLYYGDRLCFIDEEETNILLSVFSLHNNKIRVDDTKIRCIPFKNGMQLTWKGTFLETDLIYLIDDLRIKTK